MTDCDLDAMRLGAYLDGELQEDEAAEVQRHIAGCPACAAAVAEQIALKRSLRAARHSYAPSLEFRAKVVRQLASQTAATAPGKLFRMWWATAACLAAMLLLAVAWNLRMQHADGLREVADLHLNALASANPLDVVSTDRHTVKPWFQGRIPFSFNLPEFGGSEFTLLGGRVAYLQQQPGAQLFVGVGQHKISVLIFEESPQMDTGFPVQAGVHPRNAFNVETWHSSALRFVVIGDADPAAIGRLDRMLQQANP
jgi:anti-sigma factor RsiW